MRNSNYAYSNHDQFIGGVADLFELLDREKNTNILRTYTLYICRDLVHYL